MKIKKIYYLLSVSLVLLVSFVSFNGSNVYNALSTPPLAEDKISMHSVNDNTVASAQLDKIVSSIKQLQENINNQDKRFQNELALLKTSQLGDNQLEETYQEEQNDEISVSEKDQKSHQWYQNRTDAIEMALANNQSNEKLTQETQQRFEDALKVTDSNMNIQNVTCNGTICKLNAEINEGDMSIGPNIDHLVYGDMKWDGPILSKYDADTGEATIFLMSPDTDMSAYNPEVNAEL